MTPDQARLAMHRALDLARRAAEEGEVPIGAVVVHGGRVIAEAHNQTLQRADPSAHAEVLALRAASAVLQNHRLPGAWLVTTLEPCLGCFGTLIEARVSGLVVGAADSRRGALRWWKSGALSEYPAADLVLVENVECEAAAALLREAFRRRRD